MITWLVTPFTYEFMQRGLFAAIMVGILCAVMGCYVVLRSMAFMGDALAHAILPGVAVAYILKVNILFGALAAGILVSIGISYSSSSKRIKEDTAIGIFFSTALAIGVALISSIRTYAVDLTHIMFGNVLGVESKDLWQTGIISMVVIGMVIVCYRQFLVISFDPVLASTIGYPVQILNNLMLVLMTLTIIVSIQTVGVGMAAAMLVTPAATAQLVSRRLPTMIGISIGISVFSSIAGLYFSYYANISSGAAIVLIAALIFLTAFLFVPVWSQSRLRQPDNSVISNIP